MLVESSTHFLKSVRLERRKTTASVRAGPKNKDLRGTMIGLTSSAQTMAVLLWVVLLFTKASAHSDAGFVCLDGFRKVPAYGNNVDKTAVEEASSSCVDCSNLAHRWTLLDDEGHDYLWHINELKKVSSGRCHEGDILGMSLQQYAEKCVECCDTSSSVVSSLEEKTQTLDEEANTKEEHHVRTRNLQDAKNGVTPNLPSGLEGMGHDEMLRRRLAPPDQEQCSRDIAAVVSAWQAHMDLPTAPSHSLYISYKIIKDSNFYVMNPCVTIASVDPRDTFTIVGSRSTNDDRCKAKMIGGMGYDLLQKIKLGGRVAGVMSSFATFGSWSYFEAIRFDLGHQLLGRSSGLGQVIYTLPFIYWCKKYSGQTTWKNREISSDHDIFIRAGENGNTLFGVHNINLFGNIDDELRVLRDGSFDQKHAQMVRMCARTYVSNENLSAKRTHRLAYFDPRISHATGAGYCRVQRRTDQCGLPDVTTSGKMGKVQFRDNNFNFCSGEEGFHCTY